jgi:hypothetical protein
MALAAGLNACILDPDADPQASRTSQDPTQDAHAAAGAVLTFRAPWPEGASGKVDSAELRVRSPAGKVSAYPMAVSDSGLEAEISIEEQGRAEFEVAAFALGRVAYTGSISLDPARAGAATVSIALGEIGRVRIEADFAGGGME